MCEHTMLSPRRMSLDQSSCSVPMGLMRHPAGRPYILPRIPGLQRAPGVLKWRYDHSIKTNRKARDTGVGMDVDTSLFDVALHNLNYPRTWFLNGGTVTGRGERSTHPSLTPSQLYRSQDGWVFIMCNKEKSWTILADELGHPEWKVDPELCNFAVRLANRPRVTQLLDTAFSRRPTEEWIRLLAGQMPISPVYDVAQALSIPFVSERDSVLDFRYEDGHTARMIANPIRINGVDLPTNAAPAMGAHTYSLLREVGYSDEQIAVLKAEGAIGEPPMYSA